MRLSALFALALLVAMRAHGAASDVDGARIKASASEAANWLTTGRTYFEERFSPLTQVSDKNVGQLGLAWYHDFGSTIGLEATPLVADGVMYTSGVWNILLPPLPPLNPPAQTASKEVIERGAGLYRATCRLCHGLDAVSGGMTPDLRYMSVETHKDFRDTVLYGKRAKEGMAPFADMYTAQDVDAIHAYVIDRTQAAARAGAKQ